MDRRSLKQLDRHLEKYVDEMFSGMGRPERIASLHGYVTGLLLDGERKSIVPMAARLVDDPSEVQAMRQRLQECVTVSRWSDGDLWTRLARHVERRLPGIEAFVIDDTGFPKKGKCSVGVQRQYSGTLGRIDNCQVAVSLHVAGEARSACIGMDLYLPESWAKDGERRRKTGVPEEIRFQENWRISLDQLDRTLEAGVRRHVVLADAAYGDNGLFRAALDARQLPFLLSVTPNAVVWSPDSNPESKPASETGLRTTRFIDKTHPPISMAELAKRLRYRKVSWREGSRGTQLSRFAAVRVRTAHRHIGGNQPGPWRWLLVEWAKSQSAPNKYWLSSLPEKTALRTLIRLAKLRWRVERDYQEMKAEVGLDHFEGRTWRGFHHHVVLVATAHAFLALRRALFPPDHLDASRCSAAAPTNTISEARKLPTVQQTLRPRQSSSCSVANVIK